MAQRQHFALCFYEKAKAALLLSNQKLRGIVVHEVSTWKATIRTARRQWLTYAIHVYRSGDYWVDPIHNHRLK